MSAQEAPVLTIVTVVKDDPEGLRRTLDSLRNCLTDGEQYLVVDSSSDAEQTRRLIDEAGVLADYHWVPPAGVYSAMNTALELAQGDYIWFLNAGDCMYSLDALQELRRILGTAPSWVIGQVAFVGTDGAAVVPEPFDYERERRSSFARGRFPPHQGTVVQSELLRSVGGFDAEFRIVADYASALRLSKASRPLVTSTVIAIFYEGGLSSREWRHALAEFHRARRMILRPRGSAGIAEYWYTGEQLVRQSLYRAVTSLRSRHESRARLSTAEEKM